MILSFSVIIVWMTCCRINYKKIYFFAAVSLGILFMLVITPFSIPDEASHIDTAYRLSNKVMFIPDSGLSEASYKRSCDIFTDAGEKRTINLERYRWIYEDGFRNADKNDDLQLTFTADNTNNTYILYYLPGAIGMTIGRVLNLGFLMTIYLGRIC